MSNVSKKNRNISNNKKTTGTGKNITLLGVNNNLKTSNDSTANKLVNNTLTELERQKNLFMKETNQLRIDLTEKNFEINDLSTENKNLISQLKEMKTSLNGKMKIGEVFMKKMEKLKKEEKALQKHIELKDKEIDIAKKYQKIEMKEYNLIKSISDNNNIEKENALRLELENATKIKDELENENKNLRNEIQLHNLCPQKKSKLMFELNLIENAYQFEIKKNNMFNLNDLLLEEKKEKIKEKIKKRKENKKIINNKSMSYGYELRNKIFSQSKQKKSEDNMISYKASKQILKKFNTIDEQKKPAKKVLKINTNNNDYKNVEKRINTNNYDYKERQKTLFNDKEKKRLATIIPAYILNEYQLRFEALENNRYNLADQIKKEQDNNENIKNSVKLKINYSELNKKEQKLKNVELNSSLSKKKEEISKLKSEIIKINREYNIWDKLFKRKSNENAKLNKYLDNLKNKNDNNMEKEHNINLEYNKNK